MVLGIEMRDVGLRLCHEFQLTLMLFMKRFLYKRDVRSQKYVADDGSG